MAEVDTLNAAEGTAVFGITPFADLSPEEFQHQYLGTIPPDESERKLAQVAEVPAYQGSEKFVDWTKTLTTPIKDQGGCGSCW